VSKRLEEVLSRWESTKEFRTEDRLACLEGVIERAASLAPEELAYLPDDLSAAIDQYYGSKHRAWAQEPAGNQEIWAEAAGKLSPGQEAHELVHGARAATYGHPREDFRIIAKVWTGLLQDVLQPGVELDEYRVPILMSGLKLSRLVKSPQHHDSRVDTCGYMETMERLDEPEENA
jgi:hypothetical protein